MSWRLDDLGRRFFTPDDVQPADNGHRWQGPLAIPEVIATYKFASLRWRGLRYWWNPWPEMKMEMMIWLAGVDADTRAYSSCNHPHWQLLEPLYPIIGMNSQISRNNKIITVESVVIKFDTTVLPYVKMSIEKCNVSGNQPVIAMIKTVELNTIKAIILFLNVIILTAGVWK